MSNPGRHLRRKRRRRHRLAAALSQAALVLVALVVAGLPMATDYQWRTVVSGSMRPTIDPGDVILVEPFTKPVEIGDLVVFRDPIDGVGDVVHRVVDKTGGRLLTQGDANDRTDPWELDEDSILGLVALKVPKAGFLVEAAASKPGIVVFLMLPALAIMISELRVWYRFVRYGRVVFEPAPQGRHLVPEPGR